MPKFMMRILTVLCFAVFLAGCGGEVGTVSRTAIELKKKRQCRAYDRGGFCGKLL